MARPSRLAGLIEDIVSQCQPRAPSLIVTVLGDMIAPHGGAFWLGSLIRLLAPLGLSQRLVRTSVFRLTREDWLTSVQIGRRSYYSLTATALRRCEEAFGRIYHHAAGPWSGDWCVVLLGFGALDGEARERARRELQWQGFGAVAPWVLAHPTATPQAVHGKLEAIGLADGVLIMRAGAEDITPRQTMDAFVRSCWDLDRLTRDYTGFLDLFRPALGALENGADNPEQCFLLRTLLMHEYRRLTLRDPQLPEELLPHDWAGTAARLLTRNLYHRIWAPADAHLCATVVTAEGPLPAVQSAYFTRFGGLSSAPAAVAS